MWQFAFCFHDDNFHSNDPRLAIQRVYMTLGQTDPLSQGKILQKANPPQRVNPTLEKGYPTRPVDIGCLLSLCKCLKRFDWRGADPFWQVGANPGTCKQAVKFSAQERKYQALLNLGYVVGNWGISKVPQSKHA